MAILLCSICVPFLIYQTGTCKWKDITIEYFDVKLWYNFACTSTEKKLNNQGNQTLRRPSIYSVMNENRSRPLRTSRRKHKMLHILIPFVLLRQVATSLLLLMMMKQHMCIMLNFSFSFCHLEHNYLCITHDGKSMDYGKWGEILWIG